LVIDIVAKACFSHYLHPTKIVFKNIFQTSMSFWSLWLLSLVHKSPGYLRVSFVHDSAKRSISLTADHLANTYLVHGFEARKIRLHGQLCGAIFQQSAWQHLQFVDASNPLKIMVWYADFQTAVFLDRNMTELGRLNVAEAGWPAVRSLATAADGNLWVYDEASTQLLKISTAGEKLLESQPLNLEFSQRFAPIRHS
jgi:hypothetical protein